MKSLKLAILLLLFAMLASCAVEGGNAVSIIASLECGEDEYKVNKSKLKVEGNADLAVADLQTTPVGYLIKLVVEHTGDEEYEGLITFVSEYFQIEFEVPEGWDEIEGYKIPFASTLEPGNLLIATFDILPASVRDKINQNYEKNAYKNQQPYSLLRPTVTACSENSDCNGYRCIKDSEDANDGVCANTCSISPLSCDSANGYTCDIGPSLNGFCRKVCTAGVSTCEPLRDPNTNDILMEYSCIRGMCVPKDATVNPLKPEPVIVKIKLVGKNKNGSKVQTGTYYFPLSVGRQNLLSMNDAMCACHPIKVIDDTGSVILTDKANACFIQMTGNLDSECISWSTVQDSYAGAIECAWLPNCHFLLCGDLYQ